MRCYCDGKCPSCCPWEECHMWGMNADRHAYAEFFGHIKQKMAITFKGSEWKLLYNRELAAYRIHCKAGDLYEAREISWVSMSVSTLENCVDQMETCMRRSLVHWALSRMGAIEDSRGWREIA